MSLAKLCVFAQRAPGVETDAFRAWWLEQAQAARSLAGLRSCRANVVDETRAFGIAAPAAACDGTAELCFDSESALRAALASGLARADADGHCRRRVEFLTEEHLLIAGPSAGQSRMKLVVQMRRRSDLSPADFEAWWLEHVRFSRGIPGLRGYRINLVRDADGVGIQPDDAAFDGTAELWFDDLDAFEAGFGSRIGREAGQDAAAHTDARIRHITTEHVILP
jgi:uncharacterized protein (TIGR02118 family)